MSGQSPLTIRQENICTYGGVFGVLLSLTCLIQHIAVTNPQHWAAKLIVPAYLFVLLSFLLLAFQKRIALIFLLVSAVFALGIEVVWLRDASFSLVVLILLMYLVVFIVVLFTEQIPARLRQKQLAEKEEQMKWSGKI